MKINFKLYKIDITAPDTDQMMTLYYFVLTREQRILRVETHKTVHKIKIIYIFLSLHELCTERFSIK